MTKKRYHHDYLNDILDSMDKAVSFIKGLSEDNFIQDEKTSFAVIRALEVLGEATKQIPEEIKSKYPQIPWRDMSGMRDKLIHAYFGVDLRVVWKTIKKDIPMLRPLIEKVINENKKIKT